MIAKMIMDQDRDDQTALHLAVENGHIDIVRLCIEKGANVNFVKTNLITPLHLACTSGQLDIVNILVNSDADIEAKNALQETPLHRAALFNRVNIVKYLLNRWGGLHAIQKQPLGKDVLKIYNKFTGEHPCQSVISINLLCNFIEITLQHRYSPVNLLHIFRTHFLTNTSKWLLPAIVPHSFYLYHLACISFCAFYINFLK